MAPVDRFYFRTSYGCKILLEAASALSLLCIWDQTHGARNAVLRSWYSAPFLAGDVD